MGATTTAVKRRYFKEVVWTRRRRTKSYFSLGILGVIIYVVAEKFRMIYVSLFYEYFAVLNAEKDTRRIVRICHLCQCFGKLYST